jgi:hypothetical protein
MGWKIQSGITKPDKAMDPLEPRPIRKSGPGRLTFCVTLNRRETGHRVRASLQKGSWSVSS